MSAVRLCEFLMEIASQELVSRLPGQAELAKYYRRLFGPPTDECCSV